MSRPTPETPTRGRTTIDELQLVLRDYPDADTSQLWIPADEGLALVERLDLVSKSRRRWIDAFEAIDRELEALKRDAAEDALERLREAFLPVEEGLRRLDCYLDGWRFVYDPDHPEREALVALDDAISSLASALAATPTDLADEARRPLEWVGSICGIVTPADADADGHPDEPYTVGEWEKCVECANDGCRAVVCRAPGCSVCGAPEVGAHTPRTVYACGGSDYDGRPMTVVCGAADRAECPLRGKP